nr:immunoglobulin heavy chain junction region [Mus musculus]
CAREGYYGSCFAYW